MFTQLGSKLVLVPLALCGVALALVARDDGAPAWADRGRADVPQELAALVPADAFLYAQVASIDRVDGLVASFVGAFALPFEAPESLRDLLGQAIEGRMDMIDGTRPLGVALSLHDDPTAQPIPTIIVPVEFPAAFLASLMSQPANAKPALGEGYVAIPLGPKYTRATTPPAVVEKIPSGDFAVRVDLAKLLRAHRAEIEQMMSMALAAGQSEAGALPPGVDVDQVFGAMEDGFRTFADSAKAFELAVEVQGSEIDFYTAFVAHDGSPLAQFATQKSADPGRLAGYLPQGVPFALAAAFDRASQDGEVQPLMTSLLSAYPGEERDRLASYVSSFDALYDGVGDEMVVAGDVGPDGLELTYFLEAPGAASVAQGFAERLEEHFAAVPGLALSGPERLSVEGLDVTRYTLDLDASALDAEAAADIDPVAGMLHELYGEGGMRVSVAGKGDVMLLCVGGEDALSRGAAALIAGPAGTPAAFRTPLERVKGANPSFALYLDVRAVVDRVAALMGAPLQVPSDAAATPLPIVFYGAAEKATWYGGFRLDAKELYDFASSYGAGF